MKIIMKFIVYITMFNMIASDKLPTQPVMKKEADQTQKKQHTTTDKSKESKQNCFMCLACCKWLSANNPEYFGLR